MDTDLESRVHFALFLTIDKVVVVLHRDERCEFVLNCIVCHVIRLSGDASSKGGRVRTLHGVDYGMRGLGQLMRMYVRNRRTLVRIARAHADVAYVASLHDIMESLHSLFNGCVVVEPVALEHVDVVELQALQARFDSSENMLGVAIVSDSFKLDANSCTLRLRPHWFTSPTLSGS